MITSSTSDFTTEPNAAPMMTPTARSITLPRITNALKSCHMVAPPGGMGLVERPIISPTADAASPPTRFTSRVARAVPCGAGANGLEIELLLERAEHLVGDRVLVAQP